MKSGNTVPTVITDKNGKITTVHKNPVGSVRKKRIPPAPSLHKAASPEDAAEIAAALGSIKDPRSGLPRFTDTEMQEIAYKAVHFDNPKLVPSIIGLAQSDLGTLDQYSSYVQLNIFRLTNNYTPLITAYENLDLLAEGSGSIEHLFTLDNVLRLNFSRPQFGANPVQHIREHYAAKKAYPHVGRAYGSTKYEENTAYFTAIQTRPELTSELIRLVSHSDEADVKQTLPFEVLFGVHDEMPKDKERFEEIIRERGVSDMVQFMKDRGVTSFDRDVVSAYLDTHIAVNEGWL